MNVISDSSIFWSLNKQAITTHKGWSWYIRANRNDVLLWLNETFFYKPSLLECMAGPRLVRKIIVIDGQLWEMPQTFLWRESSCTLKTLFSNSNVMLPKDGVINSLASQTSCWKWEWPHYCLLLASWITPLGHIGRAVFPDWQIQVLPISATWQQPPLMHGGG